MLSPNCTLNPNQTPDTSLDASKQKQATSGTTPIYLRSIETVLTSPSLAIKRIDDEQVEPL